MTIEENNFNLLLSDGSMQISNPKVCIADAFVLFRSSESYEIVARLDAVYDFKDVPVRYQAGIANALMKNRVYYLDSDSMTNSTPSPSLDESYTWSFEERTKWREEYEAKAREIFSQRKATYDVLPWYQKLFSKRPWKYDKENYPHASKMDSEQ